MSGDGSIRVTMSAELREAAEQIRKTKEIQQEHADALGLTRSEFIKLQREMGRKEKAEKQAIVTSQKMAVTQTQVAAATKGATLASQAGAAAMSHFGLASSSALGPIGLVVGALAAAGTASFSLANRMSSLVDEVGLLAEGTGLSTRQMLAIRHAVAATGGDINKTKEALASFTRVMGTELAGKTGPEVDRVLRQTIARIEGIESPADRAAERMRVFGTESARALAGLTSGNLAEAERQTASLADRMDRAANSSAKMDEANAKLQRSLDELVVVVGDRLAPRVVQLTEALADLVDTGTTVADSTAGQIAAWSLSGGMVGEYITALSRLETAINGPARMQAEFAAITATQTQRLREQREQMEQTRAEAESWLGGWTPAPTRQPGRAAADPAAVRAAQQQARARAEAVAESTRKVQEQFRRDDFAAAVEDEEQRRLMAERGAAMMAQLEAEELASSQAAHAERMRQLAEEMAAQQQMIAMRREVLTAAASGLAQLVEASSASAEAIATARILETIAYGSVAFARALAEFGPIAGIPVAISTAAAVASQIAAIKAAPSRHMGSMAPDEGLLRVRNGERVTVEPATTAARPDRSRRGRAEVTMLQVDNRAYRAVQRATGRQDAIFGARRREAVPA